MSEVINTIPERIGVVKNMMWEKTELAVRRALEAARVEIVDNTGFPVVTGRYKLSLEGKPSGHGNESIFEVEQDKKQVVGSIGTTVVYGPRVEFGFVGKDKLGREYNQVGQYNLTRGMKQVASKLLRIISNTMNFFNP